MAPSDPNWLRLICDRGVLAYIDAVGIHGFPGTWEFDWQHWATQIEPVQAVLKQYELKAQLWITETGFSTWSHDEHGQLRAFVKAIAAPVERVYWYSLYDLHAALPSQEGFHVDERHYHMGLKRQDGTEKLLFRLWHTGGLEAVRDIGELGVRREEQGCGGAEEQGSRGAGEQGSNNNQIHTSSFILHPSSFILPPPALITGGAGFIGTNRAHRLACKGQPVRLLDNLSRPGVEQNLHWLREMHGDLVQIEVADVRDRFAVRRAIQNAGMVFHFAAQVAVTTSLSNPIHDFEVNAKGTLNVLEEMRSLKNPPPLVFTSTNKVYGGLENLHLRLRSDRYEPEDDLIRHCGISEDRPLNFQSPYGCSKGAADQYVLDYAHTFGLSAVVFRMSCIYGSHQFGTEDQGWVAHFLIRALKEQPITLYGDGMQIRDILYVEDLLDAFELAQENIEAISGQAFNIGGGKENTTSLLELIEAIAKIQGKTPTVHFDNWRPKDQRYYVSDFSKFAAATGWTPKVGIRQGVEKLYQWLQEDRSKGVMKYEVSSMKYQV
ncbi:MAG: GDP-mannose 4,6-dehydratase [Kastovskya adunca ATA6-11-RM4]|jgi:CDP-paratose 2-epimerase|nr:GDP-mannose 4,6-dehydratase [Kastovskya adunca ATA6-11-RM4]